MLSASDRLSRASEWAEANLQPLWLVVALVGGSISYLALLAWSWQHTSYDVWGAIVIAPVLVAISVPIARRVASIEGDPTMAHLLIGALVLKLLMSLVRYAVVFSVYGGSADAAVYHRWGADLSELFRTGDFDTLGQPLSSTGFVRVLTGVVYTVTGPTKLGGFVVFSWLGFWGLYFFYRAFWIAVPDGDHRRYARLVFFLPSLLFWPSSIGKEAWMSLTLGLAAYGTAKVLTHRRGGFTFAAVGLAGASMVRPHVGLIFFVGVVVAYALRRGRTRPVLGGLPKLVAFGAMAIAGIVLVGRVEELVKVDDLNAANATTEAFATVEERTDEGGSTYDIVQPSGFASYGLAVVTVLFRPFPHEAGNIQGLIASIEGLFTLALVLVSIPRGLDLFRKLRTRPYPVLALVCVLLFCWAFSSIGNFGILTRQRVQILPFLLVLVCLPRRNRMDQPADARA